MNRCEAHGLAAGPDGQCVVCRRSSPPARSTGRSAYALVIGAGLILASTAAAWSWRHRGSHPAIAAEAKAEAEDSAELSARQAEVPEAAVPHRLPPPLSLPPATQGATALPAPPRRADAAGENAAKKSAPPAGDAQRADRERAEELAAAMREVPITMYSTSWCPVCTKARAWMHARGIAFTERDVEESDDARRAQRILNPAGSVPTIDIDGRVILGFSADGIQSAIRQSAERRLARW